MPPTVRTGQKDLETRGRVTQGDSCQAVVPAGGDRVGLLEKLGRRPSCTQSLSLNQKLSMHQGLFGALRLGESAVRKDSEVLVPGLGCTCMVHQHKGSIGLQVPQVGLGKKLRDCNSAQQCPRSLCLGKPDVDQGRQERDTSPPPCSELPVCTSWGKENPGASRASRQPSVRNALASDPPTLFCFWIIALPTQQRPHHSVKILFCVVIYTLMKVYPKSSG